MLSEADYIKCQKCNGMVFREGETFTLKKVGSTQKALKKSVVSTNYYCVKCNEQIISEIKNFEIM